MLNKGGDLQHNLFDKILSIGYELETNSLSKLTLLPNTDILLNSDITNEFYNQITNEPIEEDDIYDLRRNEKVEYDVYTTKSLNSTPIVDTYSKFLVTNDIADNRFTKYLSNLCDDEEKKAIKEILRYKNQDLEDDEEGSQDEADEESEEYELAKGLKNELYSFKLDDSQKIYKINFEMSNRKTCGIFSVTEWVFTYYKPKTGKNIILDTFVNLIKNLKYHFERLTLVGQGELEMKINNKKEIIPNPVKRKLFHYPETNMYYLQSHFIDEEQNLDDICLVPQMTFSCKAMNLIDISRELIRDTYKVFPDYHKESKNRLIIINNLESCVEELFVSYNKNASSNEVFSDNIEPELLKTIKSYIFLLLFKLYQYYNNYLQDPNVKAKSAKAKYLKDTLFINSRHSNYALYIQIKNSIRNCFPQFNEIKIIEITNKLIVNEAILNIYLINQLNFVRKGAFKLSNKIDKENKHYGDPHYSLISYFEYFENPIEETEKINGKVQWSKTLELKHDWLKYNSLDVFSSVMEIKDDIILIEVRQFARILSSLISSIADEELFSEILNGSCNRILKTNSFNLTSFTVKTLYLFANLYEKIKRSSASSSKTSSKGSKKSSKNTSSKGSKKGSKNGSKKGGKCRKTKKLNLI